MKKLTFFIFSLIWLFIQPVYSIDEGVESLRQTGKAFASVARQVSPSVVFIQVEGKATPSADSAPFQGPLPFDDDFLERFFGDRFPGFPQTPSPRQPQGERRISGQGSGFVFAFEDGLVTDKSYILTNNHVVQNAETIRVQFQDGSEYEAEITGTDPQSDIAVIEISDADLPAVDFGDSSELDVGEWVVAIGNPFGLSHTLTVGVVSATGRTSVGISDYEDFIQTDAAINPGNSGGPLVNLEGKVVGINTAIFSRSGGYLGIGFAIPSNLASVIATQLIEHGEVNRGYLGIVIQKITPDLADSFDIEHNKGILVAQVSEDSPAERAGLRQGDVIVAFKGKPVNDIGKFRNSVSLTPPGSEQELTIIRNGKRKTVEVTIGKLTTDKLLSSGPSQSDSAIGLTVQTLTKDLAEQFNAEPGEGVVVTKVQAGSVAARAGIRPGAIILQVNRKEVNNAREFKRAVNSAAREKRLLLLIRDEGAQRFVALNW